MEEHMLENILLAGFFTGVVMLVFGLGLLLYGLLMERLLDVWSKRRKGG